MLLQKNSGDGVPAMLIKPDKSHLIGWQKLYRAYGEFYNHPVTDVGLDTVWKWIMDEGHVLDARVVADQDHGIIGLMHFRAMPRPLHGVEIGFLDDLFVEPAHRGSGIAEMMLKELAVIGRNRGWSVVRWLTADDNYRARGLYDRLASKTSWNLYEMACQT